MYKNFEKFALDFKDDCKKVMDEFKIIDENSKDS